MTQIASTLRTLFVLTGLALLLPVGSSVAQTAPHPVAAWSFDDPQQGAVLEERTGQRINVKTPHHPYESVDGPIGQAFRTDGYSTWLEHNVSTDLQPSEAITVEGWVALESYPTTNAPILNKYRFPDAGYFFGMDPWGRWYLAVSIDGEWWTCWADEPLPKETWIHVAGTFDAETGAMRVYLNGAIAGTAEAPAKAFTVDTTSKTTLAHDVRSPQTAGMATGHLNGILDEVALYDVALSQDQIETRADRAPSPPDPDLTVPPTRFADDRHRPAFHGMPSANWTNEPHGLVFHDGTYHLFHQRNPNGPYFQRLRWGHLTSTDLISWTEEPVALWPERDPGWDAVGTWSGDAVVQNDAVTPVYTGVDGVKAGIGIAARQPDGSFQKLPGNPVIPNAPDGTRDFRDPYVFRDGGTWHALIGSGFVSEGGAILHYTSPDLQAWTYEGPAFQAPKDVAGIFWEMPVLMQLDGDKYILELTTVEENAPARALYWIGAWDGESFTPDDPEPRPLDLVNHFLSPTIARDDADRIVAIGIVPETRPTDATQSAGWANTFSLPREWRLCDGDLCQSPAPQLESLRRAHVQRQNVIVGPDDDILPGIEGRQIEAHAVWEIGENGTAGIEIAASPNGQERTRIGYDAATGELVVNLRGSTLDPSISNAQETRIPYQPTGDEISLRVFLDHSVLDVFVDNREAFSTRIYPTLDTSTGVDVFVDDEAATFPSIDVWRLASDEPFPELPEEGETQTGARLRPVSPNPVQTGPIELSYVLPSPGPVRIAVYDLLGRRVNTIDNPSAPAGSGSIEWTPSPPLAAGIYFVRLETSSDAQARKMVVVP